MRNNNKSEIRISKSETNSEFEFFNDQRKIFTCIVAFVRVIGVLRFKNCFEFRASSFEFAPQPRGKEGDSAGEIMADIDMERYASHR